MRSQAFETGDVLLKTIKDNLRDLVLSAGHEEQTYGKYRWAVWIRLLLIFPLLYGFTFFTMLNTAPDSTPLQKTIEVLWLGFAALYVAVNIFSLFARKIRLCALLSFVCIFIELTTNEIVVLLTGTVYSQSLIFLIVTIAVYRVYFGYPQGLFAALYGTGLHIFVVVLTLTGILPQISKVTMISDTMSYPSLAVTSVISIVIGAGIAFSAINFGMNKILRLQMMIFKNWRKDFKMLEQFSDQVANCSNEHTVFSETLRAVACVTPFQRTAVVRDMGGGLEIGAMRGWDSEEMNALIRSVPVHDLLRKARTVSFPDPSDNRKSLHCFSLECENGPRATLIIGTDSVQIPDEHQKSMLSIIAQSAGAAFASIRRLSDERRMARTDALTGLYNKRYFLEECPAWFRHAPAALAIFDIDNFKSYNDTFGHIEGDTLLKLVARTIRETLREGDIVARFGGEEFVVLFAQSDLETGVRIAERIRTAIQEMKDSRVLRTVTVSGGVAAFPDDSKEPAALLECADQRLYRAKRNGRNQICRS